MPVTLEEELREQSRWKLKPRYENVPFPEQLLRNEFSSVDAHRAQMDRAVTQLLGYVARQVPYYQSLFQQLKLGVGDLQGMQALARLPVLYKATVQAESARLSPERLPPGHVDGGSSRTSGTTGQPLVVKQTRAAWAMFALLKQRELRWFRFDPMGKFAHLRPGVDLPRKPNGGLINLKAECRLDEWLTVNRYFKTGPCIGFRDHNSNEDQVRWLEQCRPDYLLGLPSNLEQVGLSLKDGVPGLKALQLISQQLTEPMRRSIEQSYRVPVHQNFGLNEIGIVASRCAEGGRYHVHTEHCVAEVVDDQGQPLPPGQWGRLVITGLTNAAMPLIRYDADDLAMMAEGPCACGRTLPALADVSGRYSRQSKLPPGTRAQLNQLGKAIEFAPPEIKALLRQYQMHQRLDRSLDMSLVVAEGDGAPLIRHLEQAWRDLTDAPALRLRVVAGIPRPARGKFQSFVSDFDQMPVPADDRSSEV